MTTLSRYPLYAVPHIVAILILIGVALSGCAAPAVLLVENGGDGAVYKLEEAGWVRYVAEQPRGLVDPAVLRLHRLDTAPITLDGLRALGLHGLDHLRASTGKPGVAEVHFVNAESGFAAYRALLQANRSRQEWADIALRDLGSNGAALRLADSSVPARGAGQR